MAALVGVELRLGRLPAGIPEGVAFLNIEVLAVAIERHVIVAVAGEAQKLCILIEGIASTGVGNQGEELVASEVVDPGKRSPGSRDDIFPVGVIEIIRASFPFLSFIIQNGVAVAVGKKRKRRADCTDICTIAEND